jgi:hypothetical protein
MVRGENHHHLSRLASYAIQAQSESLVRYWFVSFASIQIGVSDNFCPFGNKYSNKLHFGISKSGKGEEKGIVNRRNNRVNQVGWQNSFLPEIRVADLRQ